MKRSQLVSPIVVGIVLGVCALGAATPARAAEIAVECGAANLIAAIEMANGNGEADTLNLAPGCAYSYSAGDATSNDSALPRVTTPIWINGNGATIGRTDGSPQFRLLYVDGGASLTLSNVKVTGGSSGADGGGLYSNGALTVINSTISGNSAAIGGGLYATGLLTVINSTISGNSTINDGGGIYNASGTLTMTNSTISGNRASTGGGVFNSQGALTVINSTISGNYAGTGGAFYNGGGTAALTNGIVWGNASGIFNTGAFNATYSIVQGGFTNNLNVDPLFVAPEPFGSAPTTLGDYHLQANSPALNVGRNAALPADSFDLDGDSDTSEPLPVDRDGNPRVVNSTVDMGAYEHQTAAAVVVSETSVDVAEDGTTDTYTVHLASRPSGDVTVTPAGDADCSASAALTYTVDNWDDPQAVTVSAIDDAIVEGDHNCSVTNAVTSGDPGYDGIAMASVNGTISDNDPITAELLANGGFESALDGWTVKFKTGDKLLCKPGAPYAGLCAFKFAGGAGEKAQLTQTVDLTGVTFDMSDTLTLSAWFKGNNATSKTQMVLSVRYTGNPTPVQTKMTVKRNAAYTLQSLAEYVLTSGAVDEIRLTFKHKSTAGSVMIDDVSLSHLQRSGRTRSVMPPPSALKGFRGAN